MRQDYKKYRHFLLRLFLLGCVISGSGMLLQAQETREISGRVVDEKGEPMIGATVMVEGTTTGTFTDPDGQFKLTVPHDRALQVSYIGYVTQDVQTVGQNVYIVLKEQRDSTGSHFRENPYRCNYQHGAQTAGLSYIDVAARPATSRIDADPMRAIEGGTSGLYSLPIGGSSSQASLNLVRGLHSFASPGPLYVVDGVPMPADPTGTLLSHLQRSDIAYMTVLKNTSETAFYGAQGANGVVRIYTKDADRYRYTPSMSFTARGGVTLAPSSEGQSTRDVFAQEYNFNFYSGTPRSGNKLVPQVYASLNYLHTPSVVKGEGTERYSMRMNVDQQPMEKITYGVSSYASRLEINRQMGSQVFVAPYLRLDLKENLHITSRGSINRTHGIPEFLPSFYPAKGTTWSLSNLINYEAWGWTRHWREYNKWVFTGGHEEQWLLGGRRLTSFPLHSTLRTDLLDVTLNYRLDNYHSSRHNRWGSFGSVGVMHNLTQWFGKNMGSLQWLRLQTSYGTEGNLSPWLGDNWERTTKWDVGLHACWAVSQRKHYAPAHTFYLSVNYYRHLTDDVLLPGGEEYTTSGFRRYADGTQLRNEGIDISGDIYMERNTRIWHIMLKASHPTGQLRGTNPANLQSLLATVPWVATYINPNWYGSAIATHKWKRRWEARLQCNYSLGGEPLIENKIHDRYRSGNSFSIHSASIRYRYSNPLTLFLEGDDLHTFGKKRIFYPEYIPAGRSIVLGFSWRIK